MLILAIETSCDDTSVALLECIGQPYRVLSNVVSSQAEIHAPFGGVVPNLASRAHLDNIVPCLKRALGGFTKKDIDLIAVTIGPGLIPSLLIGVNAARALAYLWHKPIIGVNHIEGHIAANWLKPMSKISKTKFLISKQIFPAICLVVSGGHTQLILMNAIGNYKIIGETRDDAVGEAFDKVAKLLGLGYPGGPIIAQRAQKGNAQMFDLPRPMLKMKNYDFSFSGLKTAVLYETKRNSKKLKDANYINDLCASFQRAAVDVLIGKTIRAAKEFKTKTIILGGGVAANQELKARLDEKIKKEIPWAEFQVPDAKFCTDNAAMIALAGFWRKNKSRDWRAIKADANLRLKEISK